jgi:hypothetical protein
VAAIRTRLALGQGGDLADALSNGEWWTFDDL